MRSYTRKENAREMDTATKERISEGQRRRWAERKAAAERIANQVAALEGAKRRWNEALP